MTLQECGESRGRGYLRHITAALRGEGGPYFGFEVSCKRKMAEPQIAYTWKRPGLIFFSRSRVETKAKHRQKTVSLKWTFQADHIFKQIRLRES